MEASLFFKHDVVFTPFFIPLPLSSFYPILDGRGLGSMLKGPYQSPYKLSYIVFFYKKPPPPGTYLILKL